MISFMDVFYSKKSDELLLVDTVRYYDLRLYKVLLDNYSCILSGAGFLKFHKDLKLSYIGVL